jgi:hypothetical protein
MDEMEDKPTFVEGQISQLKEFKVSEAPKSLHTLLNIFKTEVNHFGINPASGGTLGIFQEEGSMPVAWEI